LRITNADVVYFSAILFILPNLVFITAFSAVAAVVVAAGAGVAAYVFKSGLSCNSQGLLTTPIDWRGLTACFIVGLSLCLLGGEDHVFFAGSDWFTRDAVLSDLVRGGPLVAYHYRGEDYLLRAPLGMYLTPALIGQFWGLEKAHLALLVQNSLLFASILYLLTRLTETSKLRFVLLFIFFSAVDIIPRIAVDYLQYQQTGKFELSPLTMLWNPMFSYWGNIPLLFWVPNHALPGWFFAVLFLLHLRREVDAAALGLAFAFLLMWSPLALIGALPFLALAIFRALLSNLASFRDIVAVAAAMCFAPVALYLTADAESVSRDWPILDEGFLWHYLQLLVFSIPQSWIILAMWSRVDGQYKTAVGLAILLLCVFPIYRIGGGNDLAMRGTIVPLFIVAFAFCEMVPSILADGRAAAWATVAVVTLSAATGIMEIRRAVADPSYAINDCNLLNVSDKIAEGSLPANYLGRLSRMPAWLLGKAGAPLTAEARVCWPNYSLLPERVR
jgi:hypothetical protein